MRTEVTGGGVLALAGVAAVAGLGLWLYSKRGAIAEAVQVVNPASDKNIVYQTVNTATQKATGQQGISFGSWLYDLLNPNQPNPEAPAAPSGQAWEDILARKGRDVLDGAGAVVALSPTGAKEYTLPQSREAWLLLAGAGVALYVYKHHGRKRRSRARRRS